MRYKVGDRVRITTDKSKSNKWNPEGKMDKWMGRVMTIIDVWGDCYKMEEDYNDYVGSWRWYEGMIDGLADEHKIVITTDGKTTTVKLYDGKKFIKTATAICSPEDEFDFRMGAELAVERLFTDEFFTGKAVYTGGGLFTIGQTIGKIYEFKNGFYYDDDNAKHPAVCGEGFTKGEVVAAGFLPIKE